jgi:hypothetical protein
MFLIRLHLGILAVVQQFVGLANKRLREPEAQHGCVKPIKIRPVVFDLRDKGIEKFIFRAAIVAKYELLRSLIQDQLSFGSLHHKTVGSDRLN